MPGTQSKWEILLRGSLKIMGCALVITVIAGIIGFFGPSGEMMESHADIKWISPFERSATESFETGLANLGHDEPRRYDLNGNTVFFSPAASRKSPHQLMAEYQEEFRRQGLNDQVYLDVAPQTRQQRTETALKGGIVPLIVTDDYVALGGVVTTNDARDTSDLLENFGEARRQSELFRAHRFIEISRPSTSRHTSITATWSDESFDYARMVPGSDADGQPFDATVPVCPGCTRLSRFEDQNRDDGRRVELSFIGPRTTERTRRYYAQTLPRQGWRRSDMNAPLQRVRPYFEADLRPGRTDVYRRGDETLTLSFFVDRKTGQTITVATYE